MDCSLILRFEVAYRLLFLCLIHLCVCACIEYTYVALAEKTLGLDGDYDAEIFEILEHSSVA
jgi:hypothetical protein